MKKSDQNSNDNIQDRIKKFNNVFSSTMEEIKENVEAFNKRVRQNQSLKETVVHCYTEEASDKTIEALEEMCNLAKKQAENE